MAEAFGLTYVGRAGFSTGLSDPHTIASQPLGADVTGSDKRYTVVAVAFLRGGTTDTLAVNIAGVSATIIDQGQNGFAYSVLAIADTSGLGTTGNIVLDNSVTIPQSDAIAVFRLVNPVSATPYAFTKALTHTSGVLTLSLNVPSGGAALATASARNDSAAGFTWSGLTELFDVDYGAANDYHSAALGTAAGSPRVVTATFSDTTPQGLSGISASWEGPAGGADDQSVTATLVTDADTFHGATVTRGAVSISGARHTNAQAFDSATVSATYAISGALFSDGDTFHGAAISQTGAPQTVTAALLSGAANFYTATVLPGAVGIAGTRIDDADAFYAASVSQSGAPQAITGALFSDGETFHTATVVPGLVSVTGSLFSDADTFFGATVQQAVAQDITGGLFANDNEFFGSRVGSPGTSRGDDAGPRRRLPRIVHFYYDEPPEPAKPVTKAKKIKVRPQVVEAALDVSWSGDWTLAGALGAVPRAVPILFTPPKAMPRADVESIAVAMWLMKEHQRRKREDDEDEAEIELLLAAA